MSEIEWECGGHLDPPGDSRQAGLYTKEQLDAEIERATKPLRELLERTAGFVTAASLEFGRPPEIKQIIEQLLTEIGAASDAG